MLTEIGKKYSGLNQKGATAVEFAVIAAILFVILFGILEFGMIFMQEHFIANAAREGVRIGVRANNYNCFDTSDCTEASPVYRQQTVQDAVFEYLDTLYNPADPGVDVEVSYGGDETEKTLTVTATAPNFYPPILSSLVSLIPGTGFTLPETISFTVTGDYEDPSEP